MRKANSLIGLPIVDQQGTRIATVRDLLFDTDARHATAIVVDTGGWFRDAKVVCWEEIATIGDVVLVRGAEPVVKASEAPQLQQQIKQDVRLTGIPIMSHTGQRIGTVGDLFIDDAGTVVGYEINQGLFADLHGHKFLFADQVQAVGKDAVIADAHDLPTVNQALQQRQAPSDEQAV